jgi:phosphoglycerate dehydrogenase-like enzyme
MKPKTAFFCNGGDERIDYAYAQERRERVAELTDLYPQVITHDNFHEHAGNLEGLEVIFSTWGMPSLTDDEVARLPALKLLLYGAGTVKYFASPFLERGIPVVSAWRINATCVAEFVAAQVVLSCKGYFHNLRDRHAPALRGDHETPYRAEGILGATVGLIGCGAIAREVIRLLKPFPVNIFVHDPYLADAEAGTLGVRRATPEEIFGMSTVVSNHLPNLPELRKVLTGTLFESMPDSATFINTGRGAQVDEYGLIGVLRQRPDLTALLDVTDPEPPEVNSPLYVLPNVRLTSHIAGALNGDVVRMADCVIEEFLRWRDGKPLLHAVPAAELDRMA